MLASLIIMDQGCWRVKAMRCLLGCYLLGGSGELRKSRLIIMPAGVTMSLWLEGF